MRVAIYARVSTGDKGQDTSMQTSDLRAFCAQKGWDDITEYIDEGISGSKSSRPALDKMLNDCRAGKIQIVLAWRFDRLFRSLKHLVITIDELSSMGIKFVSLKDGVDLTTPTGRFQMQILGAVAEFLRDLTRENVKAGLANARRKGKRLGPPIKPFNSERARELKEKGLSLRAIAREMGTSLGMVRRRG